MTYNRKTYYVYILKCADNSYYTGFTSDLEHRIAIHQEGHDPDSYTYSRRPVELVYADYFLDPKAAITFEKQIKGWSRAKKEALIAGNWDKIKILSMCKNETSHENLKKDD
jgi:putative endonuclease